MKTFSTTAIVALMTASIGLGALAPVLAQDTAAPSAQSETAAAKPAPDRNFRPGDGQRPGGFGGLGFFAIDRGAEAVEIALVRLSHAIDLTDAQTALLETLKTDALAAANTFEAAVEDLRPAAPAEGETAAMPDMSERFNNRIAFETARLAALKAVQPSFTAFFDSLTDEQKAELVPERRDGMDGQRPGGFGPGNHGGMNQHHHHAAEPGKR